MFLLSLSARLGYPHSDHLIQDLSARQLNDWVLFHDKHNIFFDRDDTFWSQFLSMYHNCHVDPKRDRTLNPVDFIPWRDPYEEDVTVEDMRRMCMGISSAMKNR